VPPWEDLHELSRSELRVTHLVTTDAVADVLPQTDVTVPMADASGRPVQDRFVGKSDDETMPIAKSTKTAEAAVPTGSAAAAAPAK
jgi:hypothetical protein